MSCPARGPSTAKPACWRHKWFCETALTSASARASPFYTPAASLWRFFWRAEADTGFQLGRCPSVSPLRRRSCRCARFSPFPVFLPSRLTPLPGHSAAAAPVGGPINPPRLLRHVRRSGHQLDSDSLSLSARPWSAEDSLAALVAEVARQLAAGAKLAPGATASSAAQQAPDALSAQPRRTTEQDALALRLDALPTSALKNLLLDDAAFAKLLAPDAAASDVAQLAAQLRGAVTDAARRNVQLASEAADIRSQCAIIRSTDFALAKERYDAAAAAAAALSARVAPAALLAALGQGAAADEEESEVLEGRLVAGEIGLEAFLRGHKALRRRHHLRALKVAAGQSLLG